MSAAVPPPVQGAFRAIALTVVPEAASLTETEWSRAEGIIEHALARRPAGVRRQLRLLLRALALLPPLRYGRRFSSLDSASRLAFLDAMQRFPILLVRRGAWGRSTLVFMCY